MARFSVFRRFTCPCTGLVVHGRSNAAWRGIEVDSNVWSRTEALRSFSAQQSVQPLRHDDRVSQRRNLVQQVKNEAPLRFGQHLGIRHDQPCQGTTRRDGHDLTLANPWCRLTPTFRPLQDDSGAAGKPKSATSRQSKLALRHPSAQPAEAKLSAAMRSELRN